MLIRRLLLEVRVSDENETLVQLDATGKTKLPWGNGRTWIMEESYSQCIMIYDNIVIDDMEHRRDIFRQLGMDTPTWVRVTGMMNMIGSLVGEFMEVNQSELAEESRHDPTFTYLITPIVAEFLTHDQFRQIVEEYA